MLNKQIIFAKELILTPLFLLFTLQCVSQYYNDTISTPFQHENTIAYNFQGEFLTSVNTMSDSNWVLNGWNIIQFKQYDNDYNIIREKRYKDSLHAFNSGVDLCFYENEYYFPGFRRDLFFQGNDSSYIAKFDDIGNLIWIVNFFPNIPNSRIAYINESDNGLLIAGVHNYEPDSVTQYSFVSKIDTAGNMIWSKIFDDLDNSTVIDIKSMESGDILVNLAFMDGPQNIKTRLYKLDQSGNIIWSNDYGISGPWLNSIFSTLELSDSSLICYGGISDPDGADFERSWLIKLDANGNIITDTIYKFSLNRDFFEPSYSVPIVKPDEIILLGHFREDGAAQRQSYIASIDYDLNLNWMRIHGSYLRNNELSFLHDLNNGFYLMSGHVNNEDSNSPVVDEWFMVVDSLGCDVADCSLGLNEMSKPQPGFNIHPNPAHNELSVTFDSEVMKDASVHYQIVDSYGKVHLKNELKTTSIDLSNLDSGVYFISILNEGVYLGSRKLIVQ